MGKYQSDLNDLVRSAYVAQEGFDNWDAGKTHYPGPFGQPARACDLDTVVAELDEANLALVSYVAMHAVDICNDIGVDPQEILV